MQFFSTNNPELRVDLEEAIFRGLPADNGLYMPERIDPLPESFFQELPDLSFSEIGFRVSRQLLKGAIADDALRSIVEEAINFPAPLIKLDEQKSILELFHGPSLAFKDFGARFMSRLMAHFNKEKDKQLVILVATSGDTGGAVAAGFYQTPGIEVVILYPKGKVSLLQEKQLTTLGHNIKALEVDGTFDDCQHLVKQAFLDEDLRDQIRLSSANSINIARLIPQSFYYFEAYKQLLGQGIITPPVFCIPSGNFGNLTAGLLAHRLGLPVTQFIAATNSNDVVPQYLQSGNYNPRPSVATLSNAMDVGKPSNFARMANLYGQINGRDPLEKATWESMRQLITGYAFTDLETEAAVQLVKDRFDYTIDPHGAVGYLALDRYQKETNSSHGIILETAHPSKFKPDVERILRHEIEVPERLAELENREKVAVEMSIIYSPVRKWLLEQYV
ncbi:threonine synthase [Lewinellaceae bacterium SD302]|nr:threonine synthase [Lewinellaceae bacterium SD302]